eukprot:COSAG01_NODE_56135_length_320_cov_0.941176_2_plen_79_part_01
MRLARATAAAHPRDLVLFEELESCLGKVIHAGEIIIEIWIYFLDLIAELAAGRLQRHTVVNHRAQARLRDIRACLSHHD